jgi:hypothetical protein
MFETHLHFAHKRTGYLISVQKARVCQNQTAGAQRAKQMCVFGMRNVCARMEMS